MIKLDNYEHISIYKKIYEFKDSGRIINLTQKSVLNYIKNDPSSTYKSDIDLLNLNLKDELLDYVDDYISFEVFSPSDAQTMEGERTNSVCFFF